MTCTAEYCAVQYPHTHEPAGMLGLEYGRPREPVLDMYYNPINERSCKPCEATRAKREPRVITGQRPPISFLKPPAQMPAVVSNLVPPGFSPPPMMEVFQRKPKDVPFEQKGKLESEAFILVPEVSNKKAFPTPGTDVNPPSETKKILEKKDDIVTVQMPEENKASDVVPNLPAQTDTIQPATTTLSVNLPDDKPNVVRQPRSALCDDPRFAGTELCFARPDGSYQQLPMCGSVDMASYIANRLIGAAGNTLTVDQLLNDGLICDAVKLLLQPGANRADAAKVVTDIVDGVKQIAESQGDTLVAAKAAETTRAGGAVWAPWMMYESRSASGVGDRSMIGSSTGKRSVDQRGRITLIGVPAHSGVFVNDTLREFVESFDRATTGTVVILHSPGFVFVEAWTAKGYYYGSGDLPARGNVSISLSLGQAQRRDEYLAVARSVSGVRADLARVRSATGYTTRAGGAVWAPWMMYESRSASGVGDRSMIGSSTGKRSVDQRGRITLTGVPVGSIVIVNDSNPVVESFDRATLTAVLLHSPGFVFVEVETAKGEYMYGFGNLPARGNISIRLSRGQAQSRDRYLAQARGNIGELGIGPANGMGEWSMHGGRR